jgi:hypothetical protein
LEKARLITFIFSDLRELNAGRIGFSEGEKVRPQKMKMIEIISSDAGSMIHNEPHMTRRYLMGN